MYGYFFNTFTYETVLKLQEEFYQNKSHEGSSTKNAKIEFYFVVMKDTLLNFIFL